MAHHASPARSITRPLAGLLVLAAGCAAMAADAPEQNLGRYFGFESPRFIVVDQGFGPVAAGDFNADGRNDLAVVNNRKSRIEVHLQRATSRLDDPDALAAPAAAGSGGVNDLPPSAWFDRVDLPLRQRVSAIASHDVDGDGRTDILYAGDGGEFVVLRQTEDGDFPELGRTRVFGLSATKDGLRIADVLGERNDGPEVVTLVGGRVRVYSITRNGMLGDHVELGANDGSREQVVAVYTEDFTGDGLTDIVGVVPDNAFTIRLWAQERAVPRRLGPELRFETPPLRDAQPVRFPDRAAASLAVIERATDRVRVHDLAVERVRSESSGDTVVERDAQAEILSLAGSSGSGTRSVVVADITGNGFDDLVTVDREGNATLLYAQRTGAPLRQPERFSTFKNPKAVAAGQWDGAGPLEVFVLSEDEKAVGVSFYENDRLTFPQPVTLATAGATPETHAFVDIGAGGSPRPALAVVVSERRDITLELHEPESSGRAPRTVALKDMRRAPSAIVPADVDQDGAVDLLLLTPGEPMVMVQGASGEGELSVRTDKQMPQFGLVQAAGPDNTALLDVDGDGKRELLIADANFVRAARFDPERGWRVVEQATDSERRAAFSALTVMDVDGRRRLLAADKSSRRIAAFERDDRGEWSVVDRVRIAGVEPVSIYTGSFTGDETPNLLALSSDALGIVRLAGERVALEPVASWRADTDTRTDHDLEAGDVNGDGYTDLVVLDAGEKRCSILTFTKQRRLLFATEFEVFQTRLFEQERQSDLQPSQSIIGDFTGDGANDLVILVHDRVIVYPQMTTPNAD
ncbi:MAG: FG-GAP repeat domain-containing protein [Phycisphaerales bacterium]